MWRKRNVSSASTMAYQEDGVVLMISVHFESLACPARVRVSDSSVPGEMAARMEEYNQIRRLIQQCSSTDRSGVQLAIVITAPMSNYYQDVIRYWNWLVRREREAEYRKEENEENEAANAVSPINHSLWDPASPRTRLMIWDISRFVIDMRSSEMNWTEQQPMQPTGQQKPVSILAPAV